VILKELRAKWQAEGLTELQMKDAWNEYVPEHLLPRLHGFELNMAPYAIAHLKLALKLKETGYDFASDQRLQVYLTNTLEDISEVSLEQLSGWLADESQAAHHIKRDVPITAVVGNPPYAGHSANKGEWIRKLLRGQVPGDSGQSYFEVDGAPLRERNPKWLNDDYVKFIRWAQWRLSRTGWGVLGFITNHSYMDNPTFRGMRQSLLGSYDAISVLDLHGNDRKKERVPEEVQRTEGIGPRDENVFDILQGVAVSVSVRALDHVSDCQPASVIHSDMWGVRERKYALLIGNTASNACWTVLDPRGPHYYFIPCDYELEEEYEAGWPLNEIFPVNSVGIVTARDHLTIQWTAREMLAVARDFADLEPEEARAEFGLGKDVRDWKVQWAQQDLLDDGLRRSSVTPLVYRPFDTRYTYYTGKTRGFICRPRPEVTRHMLSGGNVAVATVRQTSSASAPWCHALALRMMAESCAISNQTQEIGYVFPTCIRRDVERRARRSQARDLIPNYSDEYVAHVSSNTGMKYSGAGKAVNPPSFGSDDLTGYVYALLYSPAYRARYVDSLRRMIPRIPQTRSHSLFQELRCLGSRLTLLHMVDHDYALSDERLESYPLPEFEDDGDNVITALTKREVTADYDGKVYINKTQYFAPVPPEVFNFHIGSYQVCHKWLYDRRASARKDQDGSPVPLSEDEIEHYKMIVSIIAETIDIMAEIDRVIDRHGGWPIK